MLFKDEKHSGGESKTKQQKNIHDRLRKTPLHTHTHTHTRKPWGLSPAQHWTLQGRQHLLTSYFIVNITKKKNIVFSETLSFSLWEDTDHKTAARTHIIPSKLHVPAVHVAAESSHMHSHCEEKWFYTRNLDRRRLSKKCFDYLSLPAEYVRCSAVWSPSLSLSVCPCTMKSSTWKCALAEFSRHTHGLLLLVDEVTSSSYVLWVSFTPSCYTELWKPQDGDKKALLLKKPEEKLRRIFPLFPSL